MVGLLEVYEKREIWEKAQPMVGYDPNEWRMDKYGAVMRFSEYGQTSEFGWEIDHIVPSSKGGSDLLSNKQPLHWKHNRAKSNALLP